ncbi:glycosyltransferase [Priestia megaterium]|uniref:glycosyltransferase n=1 Tax=Priestia megaterium TaxID=1404 RepID=UPI002E1C37EF|nr:glycosyltransferase [Priestia megaterium]MED4051929.1 glycosyltransferase [Priestia megaterium]
MLRNTFLGFNGQDNLVTQKQLFKEVKNTFTIEFWAYPKETHEIEKESRHGITKTLNQRFAVTPVFGAYEDGNNSVAGVGVSVGSNGISVYEHTTDHFPPVLVFNDSIHGWIHIAVVYQNKIPTLFINGEYIRTGLKSLKKNVVPSGVFGGLDPYGFYKGGLSEIRIWSVAKTQEDLKVIMNEELSGEEKGLAGYWKLDEGSNSVAQDSTQNKNHGTILGAKWNSYETRESENKNLNVLFTFFVPSGGVETLNRQRFYALNEKGIRCDFLYSQSGTGLQNEIDTSVFITSNDDEIKEIIQEGSYDAIIVCSDLLLLKKIRGFGYKGLLIYDNQGLGYNKEYAEDYLKNHAYSDIEEYSDAIMYPKTPHLIEAFEKIFPSKRKYCFHNCFNTNVFKYESHPRTNQTIIGWVGRIEENKNWKDFLKIGAELIQKSSDIQLWMFEDNTLSTKEERLSFEKKIEELGIKDNLTIYANQPHSKMAEYFSKIGDSGGFLCSTSKVEGFGYAVLEAMVCRCPVLSTDSDGVRSFIKHDLTGKFFQLGNIREAVEQGEELLFNFPLREEIRINAVDHINKNFSPEKYAENFINMINDLKR